MPELLTRVIKRGAWPLLVVWVVALAAAGLGAAKPLPDRLSGGGWYAPGAESAAVGKELSGGFTGRGRSSLTLVVRDERHTVADPGFAPRVAAVIRSVLRDKRLRATGSYGWQTVPDEDQGRFVARDQRTVVTQIGLGLDDGAARRVLPAIQIAHNEAAEREGLKVGFVGSAALWGEVDRLSQDGLAKAALIAIPLILVILLWMYRGVAAAVVSLVVPGTAIGFALGLLALLASHVEISVFGRNAAMLIGLGVSVDYSLFVIARFREELLDGRDTTTALAATLRTSGQTVFRAGLIVVPATGTLFLIDLDAVRSLALGIVVVVVFAMLAALVVLPAVLYLLGERVLWGRLPTRRGDGRAAALAGRVMRRPLVFLAVSVAALALLALPATSLRTFTPDDRILPASSQVRWGYDAINAGFGFGAASPIRVVAHTAEPLEATAVAGSVVTLNDQIASLPWVTRVDSPLPALRASDADHPFAALAALPAEARQEAAYYLSADHRTIVLEVVVRDTASGNRARTTLATIREITQGIDRPGLAIAVGGETAEGVDADQVIADGLPWVLLSMFAGLYVLLLVAFRSAVLPLHAIAMNLLSVGAAYGVLVLVFQRLGHLQSLVPITLLALLAGLGTDHEVFLLGRIREERTARAAPLISGAAVLTVACLAVASVMPLRQLGGGAALAVLLDATVVRLIVVPASLRLLGAWNRRLPGRSAALTPAEES